ncbi:MAG: hypothetical protein GY953_03225 [bacterium]|nr:hypothetical protein [bacterium]
MYRRSVSWNVIVARVMLLGMLCVVATTLSAQTEDPPTTRTFIYSAKFVCKNAGFPAPTDAARAFTPAVYRTVINVHNFHAESMTIVIGAVEAHSVANPNPGVSGRVEKTLQPNQAVFISCNAIQEILGDLPDVQNRVDGFVNIVAKRRLTAAAVYSAVNRSHIDPNDGVTLDVERIRARIIRRDGSVEEE